MGIEAKWDVGKVNQFLLNRGNPVPLWQTARAWTIGFRRDDLERTHWNKLGRSKSAD
jgi:hypothetical protein